MVGECPLPPVISVIGAGRIGRDVIHHIETARHLQLGRVLTRRGVRDTDDLQTFLATPADVIIDAAGPDSLRSHGVACLGRSDLWSVGAAALVDGQLLARLGDTARRHGTRLRLFAPWAFGIGTAPPSAITRLTLRITRGDGEPEWSGPLDEAARRFPDAVNFAVAAALAGPGIAATRMEFRTGPVGVHRIETECETEAGRYTSRVDLDTSGRHPTALALISGLDALSTAVVYG